MKNRDITEIFNATDYWKLLVSDNNDIQYCLTKETFEDLLHECSKGLTNDLITQSHKWYLKPHLLAFDFSVEQISEFKNFEKMFYGILCNELNKSFYHKNLYEKLLEKDYNFKMIVQMLSDKKMWKVFSNILTHVYMNDVQVPITLKNAILEFVEHKELTLTQFILFGFLVGERLDKKPTDYKFLSHFYTTLENLESLLTEEELKMYFQTFRKIEYITSHKMFNKVVEYSKIFKYSWDTNMFSYNGRINKKKIKGVSYISHSFIQKVLDKDEYIENKNFVFAYLYKLHEHDAEWRQLLPRLIQSTTDII